jgi:hypothetical protein
MKTMSDKEIIEQLKARIEVLEGLAGVKPAPPAPSAPRPTFENTDQVLDRMFRSSEVAGDMVRAVPDKMVQGIVGDHTGRKR